MKQACEIPGAEDNRSFLRSLVIDLLEKKNR